MPGAAVRAVERRARRRTRADGDKRTLHWRLDVPHSCYLITLAVGDFAAIETTLARRAGRLLRASAAARPRPSARSRARRRCSSCSRTQFGVPYPYPRYAQVFVADFIFGGMENTSATTLTDTVLLDERAALDYDVDALVAHELAHQWFGDLVTCRDWGEGWLNEGFATYSEYLWREHHEGRDAADLELEEWAETYFGEDAGRYRRTIATKLYDEPIDIFDHHLYEKGGRVLHMLRDVLGDDAFWTALAHYLEQAPARRRRVARPRARGRGRDRQEPRLVLQPVGDRRRRATPSSTSRSRWDPEQRARDASRSSRSRRSRARRRCSGCRRRCGSGSATTIVDVPIEIVDAKHVFHIRLDGEPTPGDLRSRPRRCSRARKIDKPEPMWIAELAGATLAIDRVGRRAGAGEARRARAPSARSAIALATRSVLGGARRRGGSRSRTIRTPSRARPR